jgi:single-strand DNA-binding protein
MKSSMRNKVILVGNLGGDPVVQEFTGGNKVARFQMATTENYVNKEGERKQDVQWHTVVAWGKMADLVLKLMKKGSMATIEGRLNTRVYEVKDKDSSDNRRWVTEVLMTDFVLASGRNENKAAA